ncbi:hypothetical protein MBEBAB_2746 [Brevundimonas abyssalis TAR-001]|uniref:Uncharacterized protein n=1 Tax=Brevundimonas abyssalis TAR-001 TaxID=1391729 RepID=A0A8E0NDV7_9CAUL|nr:hypothetical protein MBEBAB_2746 [Brevundimonas abyssalis TAR-001]
MPAPDQIVRLHLLTRRPRRRISRPGRVAFRRPAPFRPGFEALRFLGFPVVAFAVRRHYKTRSDLGATRPSGPAPPIYEAVWNTEGFCSYGSFRPVRTKAGRS